MKITTEVSGNGLFRYPEKIFRKFWRRITERNWGAGPEDLFRASAQLINEILKRRTTFLKESQGCQKSALSLHGVSGRKVAPETIFTISAWKRNSQSSTRNADSARKKFLNGNRMRGSATGAWAGLPLASLDALASGELSGSRAFPAL